MPEKRHAYNGDFNVTLTTQPRHSAQAVHWAYLCVTKLVSGRAVRTCALAVSGAPVMADSFNPTNLVCGRVAGEYKSR